MPTHVHHSHNPEPVRQSREPEARERPVAGQALSPGPPAGFQERRGNPVHQEAVALAGGEMIDWDCRIFSDDGEHPIHYEILERRLVRAHEYHPATEAGVGYDLLDADAEWGGHHQDGRASEWPSVSRLE